MSKPSLCSRPQPGVPAPSPSSLPVIENCDGCGLCCLNFAVPPVGPALPEEWDKLPKRLQDELTAYRKSPLYRALEYGPMGGPCLWLNLRTGKCRHYEHRPTVCRDFELGSEPCRAFRETDALAKVQIGA